MIIASELTENIVFDLINSQNLFPINFDTAWKWLQFARKDNAKRSLSRCGFMPGIDYFVASPPTGGGLGNETSINSDCENISLDKNDSDQQIWLRSVEC
jgi:hypothetical protein